MTTEQDELKPLVEALRRKVNSYADRLEELEDENDNLKERLNQLEQVVNPDPARTEYDELTKERKVHRLRKKLVEKAYESNGKWSMEYNDVKWLFDGHPSPGHCYDLMERAGQIDGFRYQERASENNRVTVALEGVNEKQLFHAANKDDTTKAPRNNA